MNSNKRMTKQESLEACIKMWDWLAANPQANKSEAIHTLGLDTRISNTADCAACYYSDQQLQQQQLYANIFLKGRCSYCPVWTNVKILGRAYNGCMAKDSPYYIWSFSTAHSVRSKTAKKIVALARKELAKLLKKQAADKKRRSKSNG